MPFGFAGGLFAWHLNIFKDKYSGAVNGFLATIMAYIILATGLICLGVLPGLFTGENISGSILTSIGIFIIGFIATFWVTIPSGMMAGRIYEENYRTDKEI